MSAPTAARLLMTGELVSGKPFNAFWINGLAVSVSNRTRQMREASTTVDTGLVFTHWPSSASIFS